MAKSKFFNFTNTIGQIIILGLIILFLVNIGRSIWKNHQVSQQIALLETQIDDLQNERLNLQNRLMYYETETYKELEARKHLNYIKKDEKVLSLLKKNTNTINLNQEKNKNETDTKNTDSSPNWQKWIQYIFS